MGNISVEYREVRANNSVAGERAYDIAATLHVRDGQTVTVGGGQVSVKDNPDVVATFDSWDGKSLGVQFTAGLAEGRGEVLTAIEAFVKECLEDKALTGQEPVE